MKYQLISLLFLLFVLTSCDNEEVIVYESTGQIMGFDLTLTPCSGGYILVLDNDDTSYRIEEFPSDFDFDPQTAIFPLDIELNWTFNRECGGWNTFVDVDDIAYIE